MSTGKLHKKWTRRKWRSTSRESGWKNRSSHARDCVSHNTVCSVWPPTCSYIGCSKTYATFIHLFLHDCLQWSTRAQNEWGWRRDVERDRIFRNQATRDAQGTLSDPLWTTSPVAVTSTFWSEHYRTHPPCFAYWLECFHYCHLSFLEILFDNISVLSGLKKLFLDLFTLVN